VEHRFEKNSIDLHTAETYGGNKNVEENARISGSGQVGEKASGMEYVRRHDNTLKVLAVQWAIDNGLLPEGKKWYTERWERRKVIENNGKKQYWNWEHKMSCTGRRPDLTLEDSEKKETLTDMACHIPLLYYYIQDLHRYQCFYTEGIPNYPV
jgi:hypothetical protein